MRFYIHKKVVVSDLSLLRWNCGSFEYTINCYDLFNSWYSLFSCCLFCSLCLEFPSFFSLKWPAQFVPTPMTKFSISVKTVVTRGAQSQLMSLQRKGFGAVWIKAKLKPGWTFQLRKRKPQAMLNRSQSWNWNCLNSYLQRPKNISSALPIDIVKCLVWKDGDGRTVVHKTHCKFLGLKGKTSV